MNGKKRSFRTSLYEDQEQAFIEANPKLDPKRAARIFKTAQLTTEMMSELPKRSKNGAFNSIDVPVPQEGIELIHQDISDPATMEKILLRRNWHHFRQAEDTPLANSEIIEKIGFGASSELADKILDGTADLKAITSDLMSIQLLKFFRTDKSESNVVVTKDKMMDKYRKWKELTSTSPLC